MTLLVQRIIGGIGDGTLYGFVALALVLSFRGTGLINFAQGEMAMFSTFVIWELAGGGVGLPIVIAMLGGILASFVFGGVTERVVLRPFEGGDHLRQTIVTIALALVIDGLAGYLFPTVAEALPSPFPSSDLSLGNVTLPVATIGILSLAAFVGIGLKLLLKHTRVGLAMRAVASNRESARLHGVNVERTLMYSWGLASAIGALAGGLLAPELFLTTSMMQPVLIYAFAAAAIGGFDSVGGALIGGLIVGVTEYLSAGYLPVFGNQLAVASAMLVILFVLLVRPQGLFGSERVIRL